MKIKTSVPIPLKTKMIIPLTFHQIDFDWDIVDQYLKKMKIGQFLPKKRNI